MSTISEQKASEAYPNALIGNLKKDGFIKGYDQAMQDIFYYIEACIPFEELSAKDIRCFIQECKECFKGED